MLNENEKFEEQRAYINYKLTCQVVNLLFFQLQREVAQLTIRLCNQLFNSQHTRVDAPITSR
jgi:hypothetical protein